LTILISQNRISRREPTLLTSRNAMGRFRLHSSNAQFTGDDELICECDTEEEARKVAELAVDVLPQDHSSVFWVDVFDTTRFDDLGRWKLVARIQRQEDDLVRKESPQFIQPPQSQMALMKKNPIVAFILGVIFGPLGYLYIGWRYALLAFGVILVFTLVINVAGFPLPVWVPYVVLFVFGYKAHTICSARNELVERGEFDQVQNLNSFPFAVMAMSDLLVGIGLFYAAILGLWVSVLLILDGSVLAGLAMLFIGTPILVWISSLVFGLIALGVDSLAGGDENIFRS